MVLNRILVPVKEGEADSEAIRLARSLLPKKKGQISIVYVTEV